MAPRRGTRILLITVTFLAAVFLAAALVVPRLIDLNTYHDRAVREAEAVLHRPVRLGDMRLSLLPPIGVRVRGIGIGGAGAGAPDLLTVKEASVRLRVLPLLLRREIAVGSIALREPAVALHRLRDGRWDLPGAGREEASGIAPAPPAGGAGAPGGTAGGTSAAPSAIAIDHLRIDRGSIHFIDEAGAAKSATRADLEALDLSASFEARAGRVSASAKGEIGKLGLQIPGAVSIRDGRLSFKGSFEAAGGRASADLASFSLAYGGISLSGRGGFRSDPRSIEASLEIDPSNIRPADLAAAAAHFGAPLPAGLFGAEEVSLGLEAGATLARGETGEWVLRELDVRRAEIGGAHVRLARDRRGDLLIGGERVARGAPEPVREAGSGKERGSSSRQAGGTGTEARGLAPGGGGESGPGAAVAGAGPAGMPIRIGRLRIRDAHIEYRDEALSPQKPFELDLRPVSLELSGIAPGGRCRVSLQASLPDHKDVLDLEAEATLQSGAPPTHWPIEARMRVHDFPIERLSGLLAHAAGIRAEGGSAGLEIEARGVPARSLAFKGKAGVHGTRAAPLPQRLPGAGREAAAHGAAPVAPIDCDLDFDLEVGEAGRKVAVRGVRFSFPRSRLSASGSFERRPAGIWVDLSIPESKISPQDIRVLTPALNLEFPPGLSATEPVMLQGKISGPLERPEDLQLAGSLALRGVRFESPDLGKAIEDVGARVEFTRNAITIRDLTARLGGTRVSGSFGLESFTAPRVTFDLASDRADLGELLALLQPAGGPPAAGGGAAARPAGAGASGPSSGSSAGPGAAPAALPPSPILVKTSGHGTLRIKEGVFGTFDFAAFSGTVKMSGLSVDFDPLSFRLYGGTYGGAATVDLSGKQPRFTYRMRLEGVRAEPLIEDNLQMKELFGGTLTADLELAGSGRDYDTIVSTLTGKGSLRVLDGYVGKLNVMGGIARAADLFGEATLRDLGRSISEERTPFRELSGDVTIGGGRVSSQNLKILSDKMNLLGKGHFTLDGKLDFDLKAVFSDALSRSMEREESKARYLGREGNRYAVPLTITGTLLAPSFGLDLHQVARAAVKQTVRESLLKRLGLPASGSGAVAPAPSAGSPAAPGPTSSAPSASKPTPAGAATSAPAPPRDLAVQISEARLSGNFLRPDLRLKGAFSGAGISHADLIIKERGGKVLYQKQRAFPAIDAYFATHERSAPAEIPFSQRVEDAPLLMRGIDVTVVLHGTDGSRAEQTVSASR